MAINQALISELKHEAQNTRKMLERVPAEHFGWQPHEKSMTLQTLAAHTANLAQWISITINQDELDLAGDLKRFVPQNTEEIVKHHDEWIAKAFEALENTNDGELMRPWKLRKGDYVILEQPKAVILRGMCLNHMIHHRGQLSVYLRMLNVPIPGMYGPSADEMAAMTASN